MEKLFQKWSFTLVQGILLVLLSFYVFSHPLATLMALTFWLSLVVLFEGIAGIIDWLLTNKDERFSASLLWSVASALFGILLVAKAGFAINLLTTLVGIWMLLTGFWLTKEGWAIKSAGALGWIILIIGIGSLISGIMVIFSIGAGAVAISTILGAQLFFSGIGLIILALLKRKLKATVKQSAAAFFDHFSTERNTNKKTSKQ